MGAVDGYCCDFFMNEGCFRESKKSGEICASEGAGGRGIGSVMSIGSGASTVDLTAATWS